jgi:hypothetical protein
MNKEGQPTPIEIKEINPRTLNLSEFKESRELLHPFMDMRVLATLTTVKFSELDTYYQKRHAGTLPEGTIKPIFGQLLEFRDMAHFISGIPSESYPELISLGQEYTGVSVNDGKLFACNKNKIEVFGNRKVEKIIHPLFNDLRYIDFIPDGKSLLVCSSGTDSLLEFEYPDMLLKWAWYAPEHGYIEAPDGTLVVTQKMLANVNAHDRTLRIVDDGTDYSREVIETTSQSSHINSGKYLSNDGNLIGATLYQGGDAILIDKQAGTTRKILSGLDRPHGFFKFGSESDNYVITSARSGLIDVMNRDFEHTHRINGDFKRFEAPMTWIQNSFPVSGDILASIDHYNRHVVFHDPFKKKRFIVNTHHDWKIFQLSFVEPGESFLYKSLLK